MIWGRVLGFGLEGPGASEQEGSTFGKVMNTMNGHQFSTLNDTKSCQVQVRRHTQTQSKILGSVVQKNQKLPTRGFLGLLARILDGDACTVLV